MDHWLTFDKIQAANNFQSQSVNHKSTDQVIFSDTFTKYFCSKKFSNTDMFTVFPRIGFIGSLFR